MIKKVINVKNNIKNISTSILILLILQVIFIFTRSIINLIPYNQIENNIQVSLSTLKAEGIFFGPTGLNPIGIKYDNWTMADDYMLMISASKDNYSLLGFVPNYLALEKSGETPIDELSDSLSSNTQGRFEYGRYWSGSLIFLMPLTIIFNLSELRFVLLFASIVCLIMITIKMHEKNDFITALIFFLFFMFSGILLNQMCPVYSQEGFVILFSLLYLYYFMDEKKLANNEVNFFIVLGAITNFLCWFSYPLLTLEVVLIIYLANLLKKCNNIVIWIKHTIVDSLCWCIGYGFTMLFKGFLCNICGVANTGTEKANALIGDYSVVERMKIAIHRTIGSGGYFNRNIIFGIVLICIIILAYGLYKKSFKIKLNIAQIISFMVISLYPFIWCFIVARHADIHGAEIMLSSGISLAFLLCFKDTLINENKNREDGKLTIKIKKIVKKIGHFLKINKVNICLSVIIYSITFLISYSVINLKELLILKAKILLLIELLYFILINIIVKFIIHIFNNYKKYKKYIIIFVIYFILNLILMILTWPGVWRWDEFHIAQKAINYYFEPWQHSLTSLLYIISLRTIPSFAFIVFTQLTIISLIVSYVVNKIAELLKYKNDKIKLLLLLPFLLPAVLINNLYPIRCILYSYLIVLFVVKTIDIIKKKSLTTYEIIYIGILAGILSTWRSEGIFIIVIMLIYIIYLKLVCKICLKKIVALGCISIVSLVAIYYFNASMISEKEKMNYTLTASLEVSTELVRHANNAGKNSDLIKEIDKVVDVERIINSKESGTWLYWNGVVRENYTKQDLKKYNKAYIQLILKYPNVFINQRLYEFELSSGLIKNVSNTVWDPTNVFESDSSAVQFVKSNYFSSPINNDIRSKIIKLFECREKNYYQTTNYYAIRYNLIIPLIISIIVCIVLLFFKKKIMYSLIYAISLMKAIIVFLTAPSGYFMYYFSDYIIGYVSLIIAIIFIYEKIKRRKELK